MSPATLHGVWCACPLVCTASTGTGKTETIRALARFLGRPVVRLSCGPDVSLPVVERALHGATNVGAWLLLDEVNRLLPQVVVAAGVLLSSALEAARVARSSESLGPSGLISSESDANVDRVKLKGVHGAFASLCTLNPCPVVLQVQGSATASGATASLTSLGERLLPGESLADCT